MALPNPDSVERYQPEKECPICGEAVKGLPHHIRGEHGAE